MSFISISLPYWERRPCDLLACLTDSAFNIDIVFFTTATMISTIATATAPPATERVGKYFIHINYWDQRLFLYRLLTAVRLTGATTTENIEDTTHNQSVSAEIAMSIHEWPPRIYRRISTWKIGFQPVVGCRKLRTSFPIYAIMTRTRSKACT